ncbi:MAG: TolC family outer membrane protein [Alphaproteobacteria bacterium]|nr:TolC family outer membrane protein [Alphaproteobacteria bacterium]MBF0250736.1 TolC family outer membrane protein [Alphaproteobacteria bacterium]
MEMGRHVVKRARTLTAIGLLACLAAGPVHARPIEEELRGLLDSHLQIRQAEKTLESRFESIKETTSKYYPTVKVGTEWGPEYVNTGTTRGKPGGNPWTGVKKTANVNVKQNLFDGYETTSLLRTAEINREVAEYSLEGTRQNTLFTGVKAYVEVLRQRRLVEMARENERTIQRQLNLEDERVRRGSGVTVDVLQAKSRLQIAKERRVGYEGALANAISTYIQVFEHAPDLPTMLDPAPPAAVIPSTIERAIDIALSENPALIGTAAKVEAAREKKREIAADYYPSLDLVGDANYERNSNTTADMRKDASVLLTASWTLFNGAKTPAAMARTEFDYSATKDSYEYTATKVIEQVRLAWQSLITSRERTELLGNAVNIASEVFDSRKKLREAGKETVINVLDAENEVNNAQINYTTATYDHKLSVYQLLLSMGRLMPEYMVSER